MSSASHHDAKKPLERLFDLLALERTDLLSLLVFTVISSLLSLAIPLAAQSLVQSIAAGVFLQPLIVTSVIVLTGLLFAGGVRLMEIALVETLQQRIFTRIALSLTQQIPQVEHHAFILEYGPEQMNRFFDVTTIQKSLSKLLLIVPSSTLQIVLGLILIGFYSPLLIVFNLLLMGCFIFIGLLGIGAVKTSIQESIQKYRVAHWLEELARCHLSLKLNANPQFLLRKQDRIVQNYLSARKAHFKVLIRQLGAHFLIQAIANAGVLAIGGWLVTQQRLTLGQLVATELVVVLVLSAMDKLIQQLEPFYDLLTALDKIGHLEDLPLDEQHLNIQDRISAPLKLVGDIPMSVELKEVCFQYPDSPEPILQNVSFSVQGGHQVTVVGKSGIGKSTLGHLLAGLIQPGVGMVSLNHQELSVVDRDSLKSLVSVVSNNNAIFKGTIEDNILLGRSQLPPQNLRWALEVASLQGDLSQLTQGISTTLNSEGLNISQGMRQRILLARGIVTMPRMLVLDEALNAMDQRRKLEIWSRLTHPDMPWTFVNMTHDPTLVRLSSRVLVLENGSVSDDGAPSRLAQTSQTFNDIFPDLCHHLNTLLERGGH